MKDLQFSHILQKVEYEEIKNIICNSFNGSDCETDGISEKNCRVDDTYENHPIYTWLFEFWTRVVLTLGQRIDNDKIR